ncbi:hypothetical protein C8Q74DRAFT_1306444 [Fomes fomentarius]|nr:hypothetical protein C8Q74DRAFT_1306444 [Fomes fomentarius]
MCGAAGAGTRPISVSSISPRYKYQISKLVEDAVDYLRKCYPDNFDLLRKRTPSSFRKDHAIGDINLARLIGANRLLPTAFLICASLGLWVRGIVRAGRRLGGKVRV